MIEDPNWRSRAFAIEYWMLTILAAGALLASVQIADFLLSEV